MISIIGIFKQSNGFNVMDFKSFLVACLAYAATLTSIIISFSGLSTPFAPVFAIVWLIAAFPAIAIFACFMFRLPLPHTITRAKVICFYLSVFSSKPFAALVTVNNPTSPAKINKPTFVATSYFIGFVKVIFAVWLGVKFITAYGANKIVLLFCLVLSTANSITEPKARFIIFGSARLTENIPTTIRALNLHHFHRDIIPKNIYSSKLIACENLNRKCRAIEIDPGYVAVTLQRWADHTGKTPELIQQV